MLIPWSTFSRPQKMSCRPPGRSKTMFQNPDPKSVFELLISKIHQRGQSPPKQMAFCHRVSTHHNPKGKTALHTYKPQTPHLGTRDRQKTPLTNPNKRKRKTIADKPNKQMQTQATTDGLTKTES